MDIAFRTRKLEKAFNTAAGLRRTYGARMSGTIETRVAFLEAAGNLSLVPTVPPCRRHQLAGDRDERFAVDLVHPYRLVFEPDHDPIPRKADGGIDVERVTAIEVTEVTDYH